MPVFLICFIVFIIWIRVKTKQEDKRSSTWDENFWKRESEANFVRKKDISQLDYLTVPEGALPFSPTAEGREQKLQETVRELSGRKMIDLSGLSNTDIKMTYGTANFETLSAYDQNYTLFLRSLNQWGCYLAREAQGQQERARKILEYGILLGSDIRDTYQCLAEIYRDNDEIEKIQQLIDHVQDSDFFLKDAILRQLAIILQNY